MFSLCTEESQSSVSRQKSSEPQGNTELNLENVADFSNVCRTCASITELVIPIFTGDGIQNGLADKIHKHLPIKVSETDVLPLVVCYQCASTLMAWHELVKCCEQADLALRSRVAVNNAIDNSDKVQILRRNSVKEEEEKSRFRDMTECVREGEVLTLSRDPPTYTSPLRQCVQCNTKHAEADSNKRFTNQHELLLFYCEECNSHKDKQGFIKHINHHASQMTAKLESQQHEKISENFLVQENITIEDTPTSASASIVPKPQLARNKATKDDHISEFSDHSDTENGFGPLPESVFEAIEDTQDNEMYDDTGQTQDTDLLIDDNNENNSFNDDAPQNVTKNKKCRTCPICSKVYTASSSFFYHMKYTHKMIKEHECSICSRKFATRASLASHMTTHTRERQYECKECSKRFRSKASLYIHEQTHLGVKTWSCSECQQAFRWRTHLVRHMKRHAGEKVHVCSACGRGFSVRCDLLRHARTHSAGEYACAQCNGQFAQLRYLKVHIANKHAVEHDKK